MSLRLRLALFVGALVLALFGGLAVYLRASLGGWALGAIDADLEHHAALVAARLEIERDGEIELEDEDEGELGAFRVVDARGQALAERGFERVGAIDVRSLGRSTHEGPHGRPWRTLTREIHPEHEDRLAPERLPLRVVVAAPAERYGRIAHRFELGLGIALVVALVLGTLGAVVLAELLSRPLRRLSGEVAKIDARTLDRRVSLVGLDADLLPLAGAFNTALDGLERAFREERALVARASHALRTPIASILSVAEVSTRRARSADEHRAALEEIAALATSTAGLVRDLLALSRLDAGAPLSLEVIALDPIARELERSFAPRAAEAGLDLVLDLPSGLAIRADRARLRELLDVLLDNALRYTPAGGRFGLEAREDGDRVALSVFDTGRGIADDEREAVFARFRRGRAAEESGAPGSGLGLAIARAIIDAHHAEIAIEAREGGGTRVITRWPKASNGPDAS